MFELTAGAHNLPGPDDIAGAVAAAGYDGIDLGPLGYLGRSDIVTRLRRHGLRLAGGWVAMRFADAAGFEVDLELLRDALDVFEVAARLAPDDLPKPTLADAGSPERVANPGRGKDMPEIRLGDEEWKVFAHNVGRAAAECRTRDLEPTFHHHACTHVEAPEEIERLLQLTDIDLCLDSGHLVLGGGDPIAALNDWGERINHLHVKDCRVEVLQEVVAAGEGMESVWRRGAFCPLGTGDVEVDRFLEGIQSLDYRGWLVVEQDTMPAPGVSFERMARDQADNREFLRRRGF